MALNTGIGGFTRWKDYSRPITTEKRNGLHGSDWGLLRYILFHYLDEPCTILSYVWMNQPMFPSYPFRLTQN